jgi:transposase
MWTPDSRADHDRDELRYPSDLTDVELQLLASLLPPPAGTGRHRAWPMREMMNAIFFVLRCGCPWDRGKFGGARTRAVFSRLLSDQGWTRGLDFEASANRG